jgi:hypothetical protein
MPDYGTKNFNPGGDTPAYFSNEYGAPAVAADEVIDDGGDEVPHRSLRASEPRHHAAAWGYRTRFIATRGSGYHIRLAGHATRFTNARSTHIAAMAGRVNRHIIRAP